LESSCKRREAAKLRLQAEKAAREQEAEAEEMERMAENLSQTYGKSSRLRTYTAFILAALECRLIESFSNQKVCGFTGWEQG